MFLRMAMLNPRLTDADLAELAKQEAESTVRLFQQFSEGMEKMKTPEQRAWFMKQCWPILVSRL